MIEKVAIYARKSKGDEDYSNQLGELQEYCIKQGWTIYKIYSEVISGKESQRPEFTSIMEDASQKKFDIILVWALDRFTREGVDKVWKYISQLDYYGVSFRSYKEPYLNTDNKMVKDMLFSIMGILAEQERLRISDRTKARLKQYQDQIKSKGYAITRSGKKIRKLGKPNLPKKVKEQIVEMREQGKSFRDICKEVYYWTATRNKKFVSMGVVHKTLEEYQTK